MIETASNETTQRRSPFARAFKSLLDDTGFYTRAEWANFLSMPEARLEKIVNDEAAPIASTLRMTLDILRMRGGAAAIPSLTEFDRIAQLPADQVSPHGVHTAPTIAIYLETETLVSFGRKLRSLTPGQAINVLKEGLWPSLH